MAGIEIQVFVVVAVAADHHLIKKRAGAMIVLAICTRPLALSAVIHAKCRLNQPERNRCIVTAVLALKEQKATATPRAKILVAGETEKPSGGRPSYQSTPRPIPAPSGGDDTKRQLSEISGKLDRLISSMEN